MSRVRKSLLLLPLLCAWFCVPPRTSACATGCTGSVVVACSQCPHELPFPNGCPNCASPNLDQSRTAVLNYGSLLSISCLEGSNTCSTLGCTQPVQLSMDF